MEATTINIANTGAGFYVDSYLRIWIVGTCTRIGSIVATSIQICNPNWFTIRGLFYIKCDLTIDESSVVITSEYILEGTALDGHGNISEYSGII